MQKSVLATCGHLLRNADQFRAMFEEADIKFVTPSLKAQQFDAAQMETLLADHDTVIAGDDFITQQVLETHADRLQAVIKWGIGTDSIDKKAAQSLAIPVYNTPGAFSDEVADLALGMLLAISRQIPQIHNAVCEGSWPRVEGMTLAGKTAGIIGLGGIGRAIAARTVAFGMPTLGYDPFPVANSGAEQVDLDQLVAQSDVLLLACELTPDNHHMINADLLKRCKPGVQIVNVARGPLVDETALVAALTSGHVRAVALDVFENEPLPMDSPLRDFTHCVFGSHGGSSTAEAIHKINQRTCEMAITLVTGGDTSHFNRVV